MKTKPPVGARVKFVSYAAHGDWLQHSGQVARVTHHISRYRPGYNLEVEWSDGEQSHVPHENVVLHEPMESNA